MILNFDSSAILPFCQMHRRFLDPLPISRDADESADGRVQSGGGRLARGYYGGRDARRQLIHFEPRSEAKLASAEPPV